MEQDVQYGVIEKVGDGEFFHPARSREAAQAWVSWEDALTAGYINDGEFTPFEEATN